jgi:hypothetical protein
MKAGIKNFNKRSTVEEAEAVTMAMRMRGDRYDASIEIDFCRVQCPDALDGGDVASGQNFCPKEQKKKRKRKKEGKSIIDYGIS